MRRSAGRMEDEPSRLQYQYLFADGLKTVLICFKEEG